MQCHKCEWENPIELCEPCGAQAIAVNLDRKATESLLRIYIFLFDLLIVLESVMMAMAIQTMLTPTDGNAP